jgi:hypothetical protein
MLATATTADAGGPVVRTFFFTGGEQVYTVPAAATAVHVNAVGARGAAGAQSADGAPGGAGGFGAVIDADVPAMPGGLLFVEVGAPGTSGAFGGGGAGATSAGAGAAGGRGGGASDVRTCSIAAATCPGGGTTLQSRLLVAGGGGGGGGGWGISAGGKGGDAFADGTGFQGGPTGGQAGTGAVPCTGGTGGTTGGENGSLGAGGHGGTPTASTDFAGGGGGGGGFCGGGGGGGADGFQGAGGGSGSSFLSVNAVDIPGSADQTGVPKVTIMYTDLTAPAISIRVPGPGESVPQGSSVAADYTCTDDAGGAGLASCTGSVPSGQPLDTSTVGLHHFTVTASDNVGNSITRTVDYTVVATAARLSAVSQSASRWREGSALPTVARAKPPLGTTFKVTLDRPATVVFTFTQKRAGRKVGRKCVRPTTRNKSRRHCRRTVVAGKLTFPGHAGVNTVRFQGKLGRKKKLKPGRYTLRITATTPQGLKTSAKALTFTIVR